MKQPGRRAGLFGESGRRGGSLFFGRTRVVLTPLALALLSSACGAQPVPSDLVEPSEEVTAVIDSLMQLRRFDEVIAFLTATLNEHPQMRTLHVKLAYAYGRKGDYDSAIKHSKEELKRDGGSAPAFSLLGQAYENLGDLQKALEYFGSWKQVEPERWEPHYRMGKVCFEIGRMDCAERAFEEGLRRNPESLDLLLGKGKIEMVQGDYAEARKTFSAVITADSSSSEGTYNLGQVLIRLGEVEEGRRVLEQFRELSRQQEEIDFLQHSLDASGGGAENTFALAEAHRKNGRLDEARTQYQNTLAVDSTFWLAYHRMAYVSTLEGRYSEAVDMLDRARRLAPEQFGIRFDLAKNHALLRQTEEARFWLERATEIRSLDGVESRFIAELFVKTGLPADGKQVLEERVASHPEDHESLFGLGLLHHLTGEVAIAEPFYDLAITQAPSRERYRVLRAIALAFLGRTEESRSAVRSINNDVLKLNLTRYKNFDGAAELAELLGISP